MTSTNFDAVTSTEGCDLAPDPLQTLSGVSSDHAGRGTAPPFAHEIIEHDQGCCRGMTALRNTLRQREDHEFESEHSALDPQLHLSEPFFYRLLPHDYFSFVLLFGGPPP